MTTRTLSSVSHVNFYGARTVTLSDGAEFRVYLNTNRVDRLVYRTNDPHRLFPCFRLTTPRIAAELVALLAAHDAPQPRGIVLTTDADPYTVPVAPVLPILPCPSTATLRREAARLDRADVHDLIDALRDGEMDDSAARMVAVLRAELRKPERRAELDATRLREQGAPRAMDTQAEREWARHPDADTATLVRRIAEDRAALAYVPVCRATYVPAAALDRDLARRVAIYRAELARRTGQVVARFAGRRSLAPAHAVLRAA